MRYREHFRDYDDERIGAFVQLALSCGWADQSWHNDICPRIEFESGIDESYKALRLWLDYRDESKRELGGAQFSLELLNNSTEEWEPYPLGIADGDWNSLGAWLQSLTPKR